MNISIKILLTLYIISFPYTPFASEIIIKVPEKFHNRSLPLPPFPDEAINRLEEKNYFEQLVFNSVRSINQDKIEYIYYFNILDFTLTKRYMLEGLFTLSIDEDKTYTSLSPTVQSNHFGLFSNVTNNSVLNNSYISYIDYRLPIYIGGKLFFNIDRFESIFKYESYNHSLDMVAGIEEDNLYGSLSYKNRYKINPYIDINFRDNLDFVTGLGSSLIYSKYLFGISYFSEAFQPFVKFDFLYNRFNLNLNTNIDSNKNVNYRLLTGYKKTLYYLIGPGYNFSSDLEPINPELILASNILWGEKIIILSTKYIKGQFSFINNYLNTIISFEFFNYDNYEISAEIIYNNILFESGFTQNSDNFDFTIGCSYKVVL